MTGGLEGKCGGGEGESGEGGGAVVGGCYAGRFAAAAQGGLVGEGAAAAVAMCVCVWGGGGEGGMGVSWGV